MLDIDSVMFYYTSVTIFGGSLKIKLHQLLAARMIAMQCNDDIFDISLIYTEMKRQTSETCNELALVNKFFSVRYAAS